MELTVKQSVDVLKRGGVIAYATETVYGLGCSVSNEKAIQRLYELKQRDANHPVLVLVDGISMMQSLVTEVTAETKILIDRFWPGPLTLILKARSAVTGSITGPGHTLGLRHSSDAICQEILALYGQPLISTSANPTGMPPAHSASDVKRYFANRLDGIVDDGFREGRPSTIVDVTCSRVRLVREGDIPMRDILETIEEMD